MTVNAMLELQKAIVEALTGDVTLMALVEGVYNHVPQDSAFPYIVVGEATSSDYSTMTTQAEEITSTVLVFSRARGSKQSLEIMARLRELLHNAALALDGCTLIFQRFQEASITQTEDTNTWQGTVEFKALIEEANI